MTWKEGKEEGSMKRDRKNGVWEGRGELPWKGHPICLPKVVAKSVMAMLYASIAERRND